MSNWRHCTVMMVMSQSCVSYPRARHSIQEGSCVQYGNTLTAGADIAEPFASAQSTKQLTKAAQSCKIESKMLTE